MQGEAHVQAVLTEDDVRLIRSCALERYRLLQQAAALSNRELAKKFGISTSQVARIIAGKAWKHSGCEE